jgi:hypothetical protein
MLIINKMENSNVISLKASHVVVKGDYQKLEPLVEQKSKKYGKINMLIDVGELRGIILSAFWEDLKMSVSHPSDFNKVAFVSTNGIDKIRNKPTAPLVHAKVEVFKNQEPAKQWILNNQGE